MRSNLPCPFQSLEQISDGSGQGRCLELASLTAGVVVKKSFARLNRIAIDKPRIPGNDPANLLRLRAHL